MRFNHDWFGSLTCLVCIRWTSMKFCWVLNGTLPSSYKWGVLLSANIHTCHLNLTKKHNLLYTTAKLTHKIHTWKSHFSDISIHQSLKNHLWGIRRRHSAWASGIKNVTKHCLHGDDNAAPCRQIRRQIQSHFITCKLTKREEHE